jgi:hypothetical protein
MLDCDDPVEAVSALELALLQPMDWETKRTIRNAKDDADMGSPEKAEILLGSIDLKIGDVVISRDGIHTGKPRAENGFAQWKVAVDAASTCGGKMENSLGLARMG